MKRIFFYVQHLLGIGHLRRASLIGEAAARAGLHVDLVSGGVPVPDFAPKGVQMHQLPALKCGPGGFRDLRDERGAKVDDRWLERRRDQLLRLAQTCAPQLVLIEAFPFARRQMRFELAPLVEDLGKRRPRRRRRPLIVSSVRDILQVSSKPGRIGEIEACLGDYFDHILVHGDPDFVRLEETFPCKRDISSMLHYTGIVAPPQGCFAAGPDTPRGEVVVSAGGGTIARPLLLAAIAARPLSVAKDVPWRLIAGPGLADDAFEEVAAQIPDSVVLERYRADLPALLSAARLSISFAGYNTAAELMRIARPAVFVAFTSGGETEQALRAARLQAKGFGVAINDGDLTPERLAAAIDEAWHMKPPAASMIDLDGAGRSAELLSAWIAQSEDKV